MSQQTTPTSHDTSLDMLCHSHRRRILLTVLHDNPRDEDELADKTIAPDEAGADELEAIRRGPNFDEIAPLLTLMSNHADELPDGWP